MKIKEISYKIMHADTEHDAEQMLRNYLEEASKEECVDCVEGNYPHGHCVKCGRPSHRGDCPPKDKIELLDKDYLRRIWLVLITNPYFWEIAKETFEAGEKLKNLKETNN